LVALEASDRHNGAEDLISGEIAIDVEPRDDCRREEMSAGDRAIVCLSNFFAGDASRQASNPFKLLDRHDRPNLRSWIERIANPKRGSLRPAIGFKLLKHFLGHQNPCAARASLACIHERGEYGRACGLLEVRILKNNER